MSNDKVRVATVVLLLSLSNWLAASTGSASPSFTHQSRISVAGEPVQFSCPPDTGLYHRPPGSSANYTLVPWQQQVKVNESLLSDDPIKLDGSLWDADWTPANVTWSVTSVTLSDAGSYVCSESSEEIDGKTASDRATLIVLEATPTCHVTSDDSWSPEVDCESGQSSRNVTMSCSVTFNGDHSTEVVTWKEHGQRSTAIAPSYYVENNSRVEAFLVVPPGSRYSCVVSFRHLWSQFIHSCDVIAEDPCEGDWRSSLGDQHHMDSYKVIILTSIVIITVSICLCIFYVCTFVWLNWRPPVGEPRKGGNRNNSPIVASDDDKDTTSNEGDDDDDDCSPEVGAISQTTYL